MLLDVQAECTIAAPLNLEAIRPGPGNPIKCFMVGQTPAALVTLTSAPDSAGSPGTPVALTTVTVDVDGSVEFELPSQCLQWLITDVDTVYITLPGNQTNL